MSNLPLTGLRALVCDDSFAAAFATVGQYRGALLAHAPARESYEARAHRTAVLREMHAHAQSDVDARPATVEGWAVRVAALLGDDRGEPAFWLDENHGAPTVVDHQRKQVGSGMYGPYDDHTVPLYRQPVTAPAPAGMVLVPTPCDGKEQDAFEAWAKSQKYGMKTHPLHWLFLDRETYAARQGWSAAIRYVGTMLAAAPAAPAPTLDEAFDQVKWVLLREAAAPAAQVAADYRDAYEGAREDLLDWKGRGQRAEAELRKLGYTGITPDQPPAAAQVATLDWSAEDACEQFIAAEVDAAPEALRRLGDWLCNVLDEDQQKTASAMVLGAMMETSAAIRAASAAASAVVVDEAMALPQLPGARVMPPERNGDYQWGYDAEDMQDYAREAIAKALAAALKQRE